MSSNLLPKPTLASLEDVIPYIREYINPRISDPLNWKSRPMVSYIAGMVHMLHLQCKIGTMADATVGELKEKVKGRLEYLLKHSDLGEKEESHG